MAKAFVRAANLARQLQSEGVVGRGRQAFEQSQTYAMLQEALEAGRGDQPGGLKSAEFSLRDLAANLIFGRDGQPVGHSFLEDHLNPTREGSMTLLESEGFISTTAFAGVTGQIVISRLLESYANQAFVASRIVPSSPTRLNGERVPGITNISDPGEGKATVEEGQPFPTVGFSEEYVETPATTKRGLIVPVSKEAVFFDRTGLVLQRAGKVGEVLGLRKEKNLLGVMTGAVNTYREKRKDDAVAVNLNTFYATGGRWTNRFYSNALTNWENVDLGEQKFSETLDPNTGEPILMGGRFILACAQMNLRLQALMTGTQLWKLTDANTLGVPTVNTIGPNLLSMLQGSAVSAQLYRQLMAQCGMDSDTAKGTWFYGDPGCAFAYMENWPITVVQAPSNSEAEFSQDIVFRFKASERGQAAVMEPRCWQMHQAAAAPA